MSHISRPVFIHPFSSSSYVLKSTPGPKPETSAGCCDMSRLETSSATRPGDVLNGQSHTPKDLKPSTSTDPQPKKPREVQAWSPSAYSRAANGNQGQADHHHHDHYCCSSSCSSSYCFVCFFARAGQLDLGTQRGFFRL